MADKMVSGAVIVPQLILGSKAQPYHNEDRRKEQFRAGMGRLKPGGVLRAHVVSTTVIGPESLKSSFQQLTGIYLELNLGWLEAVALTPEQFIPIAGEYAKEVAGMLRGLLAGSLDETSLKRLWLAFWSGPAGRGDPGGVLKVFASERTELQVSKVHA